MPKQLDSIRRFVSYNKRSIHVNPFDTKRYAQNEGFYVLTDGHVMKATAIAFDLELMKLLEVRGLPG